jgi:hypothetical protein
MLHLTRAKIPVNERPVKGRPERYAVDQRFFEARYGEGRVIMGDCPLTACLLAVQAASGAPVPSMFMGGV